MTGAAALPGHPDPAAGRRRDPRPLAVSLAGQPEGGGRRRPSCPTAFLPFFAKDHVERRRERVKPACGRSWLPTAPVGVKQSNSRRANFGAVRNSPPGSWVKFHLNEIKNSSFFSPFISSSENKFAVRPPPSSSAEPEGERGSTKLRSNARRGSCRGSTESGPERAGNRRSRKAKLSPQIPSRVYDTSAERKHVSKFELLEKCFRLFITLQQQLSWRHTVEVTQGFGDKPRIFGLQLSIVR